MSDPDEADLEELAVGLREAVEEIPYGDPESVTLYKDGSGNFIIEAELDTMKDAHGDGWMDGVVHSTIREAGFEPDGVIEAPGMIQQNVKLPEEDDDGDD